MRSFRIPFWVPALFSASSVFFTLISIALKGVIGKITML